MSFAWTLFRDKILLNKDFAESMSKELEFKQIADGSTILLAANEFLLDPNYTLSYLLNSEVKFPGRYNLVIVADPTKIIKVIGHSDEKLPIVENKLKIALLN